MTLPNEVYDILKWVLTIVVPAVITLISGLAVVYGWDVETLITTIGLVATFVGALFGISSINYNKTEE